MSTFWNIVLTNEQKSASRVNNIYIIFNLKLKTKNYVIENCRKVFSNLKNEQIYNLKNC